MLTYCVLGLRDAEMGTLPCRGSQSQVAARDPELSQVTRDGWQGTNIKTHRACHLANCVFQQCLPGVGRLGRREGLCVNATSHHRFGFYCLY